ncbi:MAG TPA: rhodanese-like domain-containing protein [Stenotrophobium sp.]|jgi:rhodanese-related sulfurtransferase|nr:rhodanese-like domain-containing protein [Stenotrophobium sp.]
MKTISPRQLKEELASGRFILLDVRQPDEVALATLPDALNIPLNELPQRLAELSPEQPVVIYCHHGVRSEMAGRILERSGFADVAHLGGGIDAWSLMIDQSVPRY